MNQFHSQKPGKIAGQIISNGLTKWPIGWYVVSRSKDLQPGKILEGVICGFDYVIFRTQSGKLSALDAHCPHMGAHLARGEVIAEAIRCPLHHWEIDIEGNASGQGASCEKVKRWIVQEKFGLIFLFLGEGEPEPVPAPEFPEDYVWTTGKPIDLPTDWHSMMVNGFDMLHLNAVHKRKLLEPAKFTQVSERCLELNYKSCVTGRSLSDLMMKWLSNNCIQVSESCYGTIIVVETDLGVTKTSAILGILTTDVGVRCFGAFGIQPSPLSILRLVIARWLFTAFLKRDFKLLEGMNLNVDVQDVGVKSISSFLASLPSAD